MLDMDDVSEDTSGSDSSTGAMPFMNESSSRPQTRSARRQRYAYNDGMRSAAGGNRRQKKTPRATEISTQYDQHNSLNSSGPVQQASPEEKFVIFLAQSLKECSRQRLRAVHMSLQHYSNVEARVTQKDFNQALLDNHVKLSGRIHQHLIAKFEDHQGIDFEKLYRYLTEAHLKSGRDSVLAMQKRNDLETQPELSQEERDADLWKRLEELLVKNTTFFDLRALREAFLAKDKDKSGKLHRNDILDICSRLQIPLYGALLKSLIRRCDDEKNDFISWPEFLSFLDVSQKSAWKKHPELEELPQKARAKTPVVPDPIDGLSETTRNKLVNKLLKKATLNKVDRSMSSPDTKTISKTEHFPEETNSIDISKSDYKSETSYDNNVQEENISIKDAESTVQENASTESDVCESSDTKRLMKMRRVSNLVKTSSGFLNSVKTFISGKKKAEAEKEESVIELDSRSCENDQEQIPEARVEDVEVKEDKGDDQIDLTPHQIAVKIKDKTVILPKPPEYDKMEMILDPPQERLQMDWIYGYRGNDCRSNIYVLANEEFLYFTSNIAVLYNHATHKQRHYKEHTEDIKCIAVHSNGCRVASGQFYSKNRPQNQAHIRIWRSDTLETLYVIGAGMFEKAVMCLAFAKNTDIVAAVDNSLEKKLTIWDSLTGSFLGSASICTDVICDISFNTKNPEILVTIGKEHLAWWKIYTESGTIQPLAQPDYESYMKAKFVICLMHNERGDLVTGDSNGTIYIWGDGGNKVTNFIKHAHDGPVFTVLCYKSCILSGGRDGIIYSWLWNKNMDKIAQIQIPKSEGGVRMLQNHQDLLLIGTTMNSILSLDLNSNQGSPLEESKLDQVPITQGHYDDLRGLTTVSKVEGTFITAGQDGIICWFNTERQDPICKLVLKGAQFLCVDASSDGKVLVFGTKDGHVLILAIVGESSREILNQKICKERINCIKLSPDGRQLAVGGQDRSIYMFSILSKEDTTEAWEFVGKCKGHTGSIYTLDWSESKVEDYFVLRSCSAYPDLIFWNTANLDVIASQAPELKTITWNSGHCKLDSRIAGIWSSKPAKEGQVNCVHVCSQRHLVAMGDSQGYISLFRFPCFHNEVFSHTYKGHTTIQSLMFSQDGQYLISIGGRDSSIIQWKIV